MPIDSVFNTSILQARFPGEFSPEEIETVRRAGRLMARSLHPEAAAFSATEAERALLCLAAGADEVASAAEWLVSKEQGRLVELLHREDSDRLLAEYRRYYGATFGRYLQILVARFQEGFTPSAEEIGAWKNALPSFLPYWLRMNVLVYPRSIVPPTSGGPDRFVTFQAGLKLRQLYEFFREALHHLDAILEGLPSRPDDPSLSPEEEEALLEAQPLLIRTAFDRLRIDLGKIRRSLQALTKELGSLVLRKWAWNFGVPED